MQQLSHNTIEDLLLLIGNAGPKKTFGEFFNNLVKQRNLVLEKSGSPDKAYFSYRANKDFSLFFESSNGALNTSEGSVKFCEVSFFKKYQVKPKASPLLATENLERLFSDAFVFRSDVKAFSSALKKIGFGYSSSNLVGEFMIGHHAAYVTVDLRDIDKFIYIYMKVRPVYKS